MLERYIFVIIYQRIERASSSDSTASVMLFECAAHCRKTEVKTSAGGGGGCCEATTQRNEEVCRDL
jgi:hypothetical protein